MDQATARRLSRALNAETGGIHIATTDTHLKGEWDNECSVWIVVRVDGEIDVISAIPEGVTL